MYTIIGSRTILNTKIEQGSHFCFVFIVREVCTTPPQTLGFLTLTFSIIHLYTYMGFILYRGKICSLSEKIFILNSIILTFIFIIVILYIVEKLITQLLIKRACEQRYGGTMCLSCFVEETMGQNNQLWRNHVLQLFC